MSFVHIPHFANWGQTIPNWFLAVFPKCLRFSVNVSNNRSINKPYCWRPPFSWWYNPLGTENIEIFSSWQWWIGGQGSYIDGLKEQIKSQAMSIARIVLSKFIEIFMSKSNSGLLLCRISICISFFKIRIFFSSTD